MCICFNCCLRWYWDWLYQGLLFFWVFLAYIIIIIIIVDFILHSLLHITFHNILFFCNNLTPPFDNTSVILSHHIAIHTHTACSLLINNLIDLQRACHTDWQHIVLILIIVLVSVSWASWDILTSVSVPQTYLLT